MWWCATKDPLIFSLIASLRTHEDWRQKRTKFHYFHWCHWLHIFISFWINFYTLERTHVPIYAITQEYYHHRFLSFLVFLTTIAVQYCQLVSVEGGNLTLWEILQLLFWKIFPQLQSPDFSTAVCTAEHEGCNRLRWEGEKEGKKTNLAGKVITKIPGSISSMCLLDVPSLSPPPSYSCPRLSGFYFFGFSGFLAQLPYLGFSVLCWKRTEHSIMGGMLQV